MQQNALSVQEVINKTFSTFFNQPVETFGSGRTDAGVHALKQIFHVDLALTIGLDDLRFKLNSFLPSDISILSIVPVKSDANARFDAISRAYIYKINLVKDPFLRGLSYYFRNKLDVDAMNQAAALLIGEKDFESFSKVKTSVNHFRCHVSYARWEVNRKELYFHIKANRFLRGMVRAIVGTLLDVGTGKMQPTEIDHILAAKDRKNAGRSAPAEGLYLSEVNYPKEIYQ